MDSQGTKYELVGSQDNKPWKYRVNYSGHGHNAAAERPSYTIEQVSYGPKPLHRREVVEIKEIPPQWNRYSVGKTTEYTIKLNPQSKDIIPEIHREMARITTFVAANQPGQQSEVNEAMAGVVFHELGTAVLSDIAGNGSKDRQARSHPDVVALLSADPVITNFYQAPEKLAQLNIKPDRPQDVIKTIDTLVQAGEIDHKTAARYLAFQAGEQLKKAYGALTATSSYTRHTLHSEYGKSDESAYSAARKVIENARAYFAGAIKHDELDTGRKEGLTKKIPPIIAKLNLIEECMDRAAQCFAGRFHEQAVKLVSDGQGMHAGKLGDDSARLLKLATEYTAEHGMPRTPKELALFAQHVELQSKMKGG